jgi:uncharacterized protein YhfF
MKMFEAEQFWQDYLASSSAIRAHRNKNMPEAWNFGNTAEMADELGQLVLAGIKTATCALVTDFENGKIPQAGELSIVLDGQGNPLCLIETTEVELKPFNQVDEKFAFDEGEGDRTIEYWRKVHQDYFARQCQEKGEMWDENRMLMCERFRLLFNRQNS